MALYNELQIFDFEAAVKAGSATDQKGHTHKILMNSQQFLITELSGQENCFDTEGRQFAERRTLNLAQPAKTLFKLKHSIVYNPDDMTVYDGFRHHREANLFLKGLIAEGKVADLIVNTTHPCYEDILAKLGLERIRSIPYPDM